MLDVYMRVQRHFEGDDYKVWSHNKKEHEIKVTCYLLNVLVKLELM